VVHCPFSNLKLASGFCPVAKLLAAGVNVCIGTGATASFGAVVSGLIRAGPKQVRGRSLVGALATIADSVASNNNLSMISEVKVSASLAKAVAKDASAVPVDVALKMATINGARAYNLDKEIGSLVPGKSADFIAISVASIENFPVFNAVTHLIYSVDRSQCAPPQRKEADACRIR